LTLSFQGIMVTSMQPNEALTLEEIFVAALKPGGISA